MEVYRSPEFTSRLLGAFGDDARAWLDDLPKMVEHYVRRWELSDLTPVEEPSYGWVASCDSPSGPAMLKLSLPNPEAITEVLALRRFPTAVAAAVIHDDRDAGAVLLERLLPGTRLRLTREFEQRVHVASQVFAGLHPGPTAKVRSPQTSALFPSYYDQADRAYRLAMELAPQRLPAAAGTDLSRMVAAGRRALARLAHGAETENDSLSSMQLLHGDLHHDNILRAGEGWKLIDPKGVLGPLCLEPARFIGNQLGDAPPRAGRSQFDRMCTAFAAALSLEPGAGVSDRQRVEPESVAVAAVLDATVSTCWGIEDMVTPDWVLEGITQAIEMADWAGV